jgi:endonuclease III
MTRPASSRTALVRRARRVHRELGRLYPDARNELVFTSALELLVAAILAAQSTDVRVNEITPELFARYRGAAEYARADPAELQALIRPVGFFRAKSSTLIRLGRALCDSFGGRVPDTMDDLVSLPSVGRKTANVVLGDAFGKPSLIVNTHVIRLSRRLGWTAQTDPDRIERDLGELLPRPGWTVASHRLSWHGRQVCHARTPACGACGIARLCPSFGIGPTDEEAARKLVRPRPGPAENYPTVH